MYDTILTLLRGFVERTNRQSKWLPSPIRKSSLLRRSPRNRRKSEKSNNTFGDQKEKVGNLGVQCWYIDFLSGGTPSFRVELSTQFSTGKVRRIYESP